MACCYDHDHDYYCRCIESDADRAQQIIEDILDDSYSGEVKFEMPLTFTLGDREGAPTVPTTADLIRAPGGSASNSGEWC